MHLANRFCLQSPRSATSREVTTVNGEPTEGCPDPDIAADTTIELVDCDEACRVLGGNRPIHRATLYRGIRQGKYPPPIHTGPATSRWLKGELLDCVRAFIAKRDRA
jgi:predicted DNA-binding transcriptional regulator AlpA